MDHLEEGKSTLPHAGRGAFTRRFIGKGEVVVPLPLIHVANRSDYDMYDRRLFEEGGIQRDQSKGPVHQQLMLNYCFGHASSTLLLCPYANVASLINHNQTLANAKLQWSAKALRSPEWMEMPIELWAHGHFSGLALELVATRDLLPGEEVFFDYSDAWEEAWQDHLYRALQHFALLGMVGGLVGATVLTIGMDEAGPSKKSAGSASTGAPPSFTPRLGATMDAAGNTIPNLGFSFSLR